jgi:NAD(P)-dependent dehydrogenase (short-subunit alcohol dehydrogenase family)
MTGIRLRIGATSEFGAVVTMVNVRSFSAGDGRQESYTPANEISPPSLRWNQIGCRLSFGPVHSKKPSTGTMHRRSANAARGDVDAWADHGAVRAAYCATKHALEALAEGLKAELAGTGGGVHGEPGCLRHGIQRSRRGDDDAVADEVPTQEMCSIATSKSVPSHLWPCTQRNVNIIEEPDERPSVGRSTK